MAYLAPQLTKGTQNEGKKRSKLNEIVTRHSGHVQ
jgi:hypothetical protein